MEFCKNHRKRTLVNSLTYNFTGRNGKKSFENDSLENFQILKTTIY